MVLKKKKIEVDVLWTLVVNSGSLDHGQLVQPDTPLRRAARHCRLIAGICTHWTSICSLLSGKKFLMMSYDQLWNRGNKGWKLYFQDSKDQEDLHLPRVGVRDQKLTERRDGNIKFWSWYVTKDGEGSRFRTGVWGWPSFFLMCQAEKSLHSRLWCQNTLLHPTVIREEVYQYCCLAVVGEGG